MEIWLLNEGGDYQSLAPDDYSKIQGQKNHQTTNQISKIESS